MKKPSFDPGLTNQYTGSLQRVINKNGGFNVRREGNTWRDFHPYLLLVNMGWPSFLGTVLLAFLAVNTLFALVYFELGPGQLQGADAPTEQRYFLNMEFFSAHTLTTVGYGNIAPQGVAANVVSTVESAAGVMGFALATGLLFGRFSRPSAKIGFSERMVVAPYQEGAGLQFRIVNRRRNSLMDLEARLMLMTVAHENGEERRKYQVLRMERPGVMFLPLTWTIVHPIDSESPFWGKTAEDLARAEAEVLILIKAYDDTFSQTVFAQNSYRHDEIVWGARFTPAFHADDDGELVLEVGKVGALVSLRESA
jgi:inward rectifier potassium channel